MLKYYQFVNYGTIIIIAVLLLLVLLEQVDRSWYIPLLIASLALLVIRIIFRAIYIYQNKKQVNGD